MKKIAIGLIAILAVVLIFAFAFPFTQQITLSGQSSLSDEELSFVGNFGQLYDGLDSAKQACLRTELGAKIDSWRTDSEKRLFTKDQVSVIQSCLWGLK